MEDVLQRLAILEENVAIMKITFILLVFIEFSYLFFEIIDFIRIKIKNKNKQKEEK